jgi:hypothetical protein
MSSTKPLSISPALMPQSINKKKLGVSERTVSRHRENGLVDAISHAHLKSQAQQTVAGAAGP